MNKAFWRDAVKTVAGILGFALLIRGGIWLKNAGRDAGDPREGVCKASEAAEAYLGGYKLAGEEKAALRVWREDEADLPEWFDPDEEMAVEWIAEEANVPRRDIGCPDPELNVGMVGWDGRICEEWEMALFARIVFWEFYGTSEACCVAGADSILNLWASGYFGNTLGELLSARAENGALVYTTYAWAWDEVYDPEGLEWCRELCEERFIGGPTSGEQAFFQLYGYPSWAQPCFVIDGVYFSAFKEGWK